MARHALTQVTFWESLTGSRYRHDVGPDAPSALKYGRLGCLFNHESFYANVQVVPGCSLVIFVLFVAGCVACRRWRLWRCRAAPRTSTCPASRAQETLAVSSACGMRFGAACSN